MLIKYSQHCAVLGFNTLQPFSKVFFCLFGLNVLFEFLNAEITVVVKFGERLFDP